MAKVLISGTACTCCALVIANADESGCRDFHGHTHAQTTVPERMQRQAAEIYADTYGRPAPAEIPWGAWLVLDTAPVDEDDSDEDRSEEMVGPCEFCGNDGGNGGSSGYMTGYPVAIVA